MIKSELANYTSIDLNQMMLLVDSLPFSIYMLSSHSNEYVLANLNYAQKVGFQHKEEIMQVTHSHILLHRRRCIEALQGDVKLEESYQQFIHRADRQTAFAKTPKYFQACNLSIKGFIGVEMIQKIPIVNRIGEVDNILTLSEDVTAYLDLVDIYQLYKKHYLYGKKAIQQFLAYAHIARHFRDLPTHRELLTLLTFKKDVRAKYAARQLGLSNRTIEEYKVRLRNKLKDYMTLEELLLELRNLGSKKTANTDTCIDTAC